MNPTNTQVTNDLKRLRMSIAFFFGLAGLSFSSWAVRTPFIQEKLQLTKMDWGFLLLCPVFSSFVATLMSSFLIGRFGSHRITTFAAYLVLIAISLIGFAPSVILLAGALVVFGLGMGLIDIAMNDQAAALEKLYQRSIMSSFHGIFSVGAMLGALFGGIVARYHMIPGHHLLIVSGLLIVGVLFNQRHLLSNIDNLPIDTAEEIKPPLFVVPKGKLWILGFVASAAVFVEGAMADWSALFLENMNASEAVAALGLAFFTGTMAVGRLFGDRWVDYVGRVRAIQLGGVCSALGLLIALLSHFPILAIIGFTFAGMGISIIFPCLLTLSDRVKPKGVSSSAAIASVAMMGYVMMLFGPPMIGFLAHIVGLHLSFVALFVSSIAVAVLVGHSKP